MQKITDVAVAVLQLPDGQLLLASRPAGKPYAGYWEFPGGKIELGESVRDALIRELKEELNVVVTECSPWFSFNMVYAHASVRLHTWRVDQWQVADARGLTGLEGQQFQWQQLGELTVSPILAGCLPIFRALSLPKQYLITNASEVGVDLYLQHLREFWSNIASKHPPNAEFVNSFTPSNAAHQEAAKEQTQPQISEKSGLIQIREKSMPPAQLHEFAREVVAIAAEHKAIVLINSVNTTNNTKCNAAFIEEVGADGIHLTSQDLATCTTRPDVAWVGASVHNRNDLEHAAELKCDFAVLGHVNKTATHPDAAPLGWDAFADLITNTSIPVFAIGGMTPADMEIAKNNGAHGIAMMRAVFQSHKP